MYTKCWWIGCKCRAREQPGDNFPRRSGDCEVQLATAPRSRPCNNSCASISNTSPIIHHLVSASSSSRDKLDLGTESLITGLQWVGRAEKPYQRDTDQRRRQTDADLFISVVCRCLFTLQGIYVDHRRHFSSSKLNVKRNTSLEIHLPPLENVGFRKQSVTFFGNCSSFSTCRNVRAYELLQGRTTNQTFWRWYMMWRRFNSHYNLYARELLCKPKNHLQCDCCINNNTAL